MLSPPALLEQGESAFREGHQARAWNLATLGLGRTPGEARAALLDLQGRAARALAQAAAGSGSSAPVAPAAAPAHPPEVARASAAVKEGRLEDAVTLLDRAIARTPDCAAAHAVRGMALLALGRFVEGFAAYEWRQRLPGFEGDRPPAPRWRGGALAGGTLLLWDEQGFGDTIQFSRYAAAASRASRARLVLTAHPRICRLLRTCPGVDAVIARGQAFPSADAQLSIMSLPAVLGLGARELATASGGPTLASEPTLVASWRNRLSRLGGGAPPGAPRIGLAWQGNPRHPEDARRSLPLRALEPLVRRLAGTATFVSLQKEAAREALAPSRLPILDLGAELDVGPDAFVDTAAVMSSLDLVITTDTAVAHLAGALGVPVWVLLARPCDWRWGFEGEGSTFYSTARLFRQTALGAWDGVIEATASALEAWLARAVVVDRAASAGRVA